MKLHHEFSSIYREMLGTYQILKKLSSNAKSQGSVLYNNECFSPRQEPLEQIVT